MAGHRLPERGRVWVLAGGMLAAALGVMTPAATPAADGTAATATVAVQIEPIVYYRVQALRNHLCLTTLDLAAMRCSRQSSEQVLWTLRSWYEANQAEFEQKQREARDAEAALRAAWHAVNLGPRDQNLLSSLPALRAARESAHARRELFTERVTAQVTNSVSTEQAGMWATARANAQAPRRYRHISGLTGEQVAQLRQAIHRRGAASTLPDAERHLLRWSQLSEMQQAHANALLAGDDVVAAEATVLPTPREAEPALSADTNPKDLDP